ncbi:hypothetical protein JYA91_29495 (plasmid) [Rhodococcus sp. PSBB049]|nr:hypothetical protein JYA91_29495 [Rhodococcus sp. PSBB049]
MSGAVADMILAMADGRLEAPAPDTADPVQRWEWFADLYAHPHWGMAITVPAFPTALGAVVADACRAVPHQRHDGGVVAQQWGWLAHRARTQLKQTGSLAELHAWSAITFTALDADDHRHGRPFGGTETVTTVFSAVLAAQPPAVAGELIAAAVDAWSARRLQGTGRTA